MNKSKRKSRNWKSRNWKLFRNCFTIGDVDNRGRANSVFRTSNTMSVCPSTRYNSSKSRLILKSFFPLKASKWSRSKKPLE